METAAEIPVSRRQVLKAAAGSLAGAPAVVAAGSRPNIILCMGDDHGWNETAYNGHAYLRTPVLDEMAAGSLRFDQFYAAAPVCSPTRGSIMTGRHPNRYGTFAANWSIRPEEITAAQLLHETGYLCGHFGKWHLGPVKAASPTNPGRMGFDEWLSHDNFFDLDPWLSRKGGPIERFQGESSELLVRQAVGFIEEARAERRPFFLVIWFASPHSPYQATEKDLALYRSAPEPLRARFAEITAMDRAIGQLRQYLKKAGLRSNTLLWYCGDNGVPPEGRLDTRLRGHKGQLYEGGVRVPGIIEWPAGISQPRTTDVVAVTTDIFPTICELGGAALPSRPLDGISLVPVLRGSMRERPQPVCFWQFDISRLVTRGPEPYLAPELQEGTTPTTTLMNGRYTRTFRNLRYGPLKREDIAGEAAVRGNRFKLVLPDGVHAELYDLRDDPGESRNLLDAYPEVATEMERHLRRWQMSVLNSLTGADYPRPGTQTASRRAVWSAARGHVRRTSFAARRKNTDAAA